VDSKEVYGRSYGAMWMCKPCDAWVGCHKGTAKPMGTLANAELRNARSVLHALFDPIWENLMEERGLSKSQARTMAYEWLAREMDLHPDDCHIALFDYEMCEEVLDILSTRQPSFDRSMRR
jgi:hypothetical protein